MLISHKHKFITIDIPKTGTTSINSAVSRFIQENDFNFSMSQKMGMRHGTYEQCIAKFPNYKNYFSFAFARNPWDRMLSFYFFKRNIAPISKIDKNISFKDFLELPILNQYSYIKGFSRNSFVGRFENLQEDFDIICDKIGIPQQKLPHINKTNHKHYTEYYNNETRRLVSEKYAKDIEYFGYKFGE
jgi:hypothetical protein